MVIWGTAWFANFWIKSRTGRGLTYLAGFFIRVFSRCERKFNTNKNGPGTPLWILWGAATAALIRYWLLGRGDPPKVDLLFSSSDSQMPVQQKAKKGRHRVRSHMDQGRDTSIQFILWINQPLILLLSRLIEMKHHYYSFHVFPSFLRGTGIWT